MEKVIYGLDNILHFTKSTLKSNVERYTSVHVYKKAKIVE